MKSLIWSLTLVWAGCAGAPVPHAKMATAEAEIRAAEVVIEDLRSQGPNDLAPKAQLHLKVARDELETARKLAADEKMAEAERVLERAQADASYALVLAKEAGARAEAERVRSQVAELQKKTAGNP